MSKRICAGILIWFTIGIAGPTSAAAIITGRDIMQKQKDLQTSQYEYMNQKMILIDKNGRQEHREVRQYSKETEPDVIRSLIVFSAPSDIKGTALLTWQHKSQEDDQWLYLPARGKMQRIAKGGKKNYFMGTDLTYEDLEPDVLADFTYRRLQETELDGKPCYVIEAVAANVQKQKQSGYGKRLLWISKDHFNTLKIEFYNRRGKHIKTQINRDWVNIKGSVWRARKTLIDNLKTKHKTLMGDIKRTVNEPIADATFTERFVLKSNYTQ